MRYFLYLSIILCLVLQSINIWSLNNANQVILADSRLIELDQRADKLQADLKNLAYRVDTVHNRFEIGRKAMLCLIVIGVVVVAIGACQHYFNKPKVDESEDDTLQDGQEQK